MIRFATEKDSPQILAIYAEYIHTPITFDYVLPTQEIFTKQITETLKDYPYLVYEEEGKIQAYAYAHKLREREAYQWNAELSIYVDNTAHKKGLGHALYTTLMKILENQGIKAAYACITLPNEASLALHQHFQFTEVGRFPKAGFKNGTWHDVAWYRKELSAYEQLPAESPDTPKTQAAKAAPFRPLNHFSESELQAMLKEFAN